MNKEELIEALERACDLFEQIQIRKQIEHILEEKDGND